ncbi:MAG: hypothetical protein V4754_18570 [Pseudomonadota bacterium]
MSLPMMANLWPFCKGLPGKRTAIHQADYCHHEQKLDFCAAMQHYGSVSSILLQEIDSARFHQRAFFCSKFRLHRAATKSGGGNRPRGPLCKTDRAGRARTLPGGLSPTCERAGPILISIELQTGKA